MYLEATNGFSGVCLGGQGRGTSDHIKGAQKRGTRTPIDGMSGNPEQIFIIPSLQLIKNEFKCNYIFKKKKHISI